MQRHALVAQKWDRPEATLRDLQLLARWEGPFARTTRSSMPTETDRQTDTERPGSVLAPGGNDGGVGRSKTVGNRDGCTRRCDTKYTGLAPAPAEERSCKEDRPRLQPIPSAREAGSIWQPRSLVTSAWNAAGIGVCVDGGCKRRNSNDGNPTDEKGGRNMTVHARRLEPASHPASHSLR